MTRTPRRRPRPKRGADADAPTDGQVLAERDGATAAVGRSRLDTVRVIALALVLVAVAVYSVSTPTSAIDTWTALAEGRYVAAHGLTDADPFSFASRPSAASQLPPDASSIQRAWAWLCPTGWINQNWLAEVVLLATYRLGGTDAMFAWHIADLALVAALAALAARVRGSSTELALLLGALALLPGRQFYEIRAQDMTDVFVAALMLLLALVARGRPRAIWLAVPLLAVWGNVHGGFIWGLMALAVWVAAGVAARFAPSPVWRPSPGDLRLVAIVAALGAVGTVVASPYRVANILHPLLISVSRDAKVWREVGEWHPLKDGSASEIVTFIAFVALALGCAVAAARRVRGGPPAGTRRALEGHEPRDLAAFDLGSAAILAMTAAMAVTSRRILPLMYITGAPLVAAWCTTAFAGRRRPAHLGLRPRAGLTAATVAVSLVVTAVVGTSFARRFFGPWPTSLSQLSPGDRVLDRSSRPWGPCRFLQLNGVSGRIWTFYEDAGFWSWCQTPDPRDGHTPLQVYIDPRAQRAYDVSVFLSYHSMVAGGPTGRAADDAGRTPTAGEARTIQNWLARAMIAQGMWIVALPPEGRETAFAQYLPLVPTWRTVYLDEDHTVLVDVATAAGYDLAMRAERDALKYPDEASHALSRAALALQADDEASVRRGLELAQASYRTMATARAVVYVGAAARRLSDPREAVAFCRAIVDDVESNRATYSRENGWARRLAAAIEAADVVREHAGGGTATARWASEEFDRLTRERRQVTGGIDR